MAVNTVVTQNSINTDIPVEVIYGGTGAITLLQHGILLGNGTDAVTAAALTDGQLLIGSTGAAPSTASLTAGAGIEVTNAAGSITIANTAHNSYEVVTAATAMVEGKNYVCNGTTSLAMTLPSTIAVGKRIEITDINAGFSLAQGAGQIMHFGNKSTTSGATGSIATVQDRSSIVLVCVVADTEFNVVSSVGNYSLT